MNDTDTGQHLGWVALLASMALTIIVMATITAVAVGCCPGSPAGAIAIIVAVGFVFHVLAERRSRSKGDDLPPRRG